MKALFNDFNENLVDVFINGKLAHQIDTDTLEEYISNEELNYEVHGETIYDYDNGSISHDNEWSVIRCSPHDYLEANLDKVARLYIQEILSK